jgi:hypothetical protein
LVEEKHTFRLDPFLLNLKVCNFKFIRFNANSINREPKNAVMTDKRKDVVEFIEENMM